MEDTKSHTKTNASKLRATRTITTDVYLQA